MFTFTISEVFELVGAGAFGSLSVFLWLISSFTKRHGDEYGSWFGYMMVWLFAVAALSMLLLILKSHI